MEPRPNKPARGSTGSSPETPPATNPIYSSGDSASWATSAWSSPGTPPTSSQRAEPPPPVAPHTAHAADWRGQPGAYAPGADQGYSPGPALAPIDQRRGGSWLGPVIAIAILALIVVAVAVAFTKVRGGNSDRGAPTSVAQVNAPALTGTAEAAVAAATQITPTAPAVSPTAKADASSTKPTSTPGDPQPTDTPKAAANSTTASTASAASMLPTLDEVAAGYVVTENATRDRTGVAASFADPQKAAANLKAWGWKENAYTTFEIPAADQNDPNATTYITVSIHRFSKTSGAKSAFTYFSDAVVTAQGMADVNVDTIGDQTRELTTASADANLTVLYIRSGYYLIRMGASSPTGDPSADLIALAKKIVK